MAGSKLEGKASRGTQGQGDWAEGVNNLGRLCTHGLNAKG